MKKSLPLPQAHRSRAQTDESYFSEQVRVPVGVGWARIIWAYQPIIFIWAFWKASLSSLKHSLFGARVGLVALVDGYGSQDCGWVYSLKPGLQNQDSLRLTWPLILEELRSKIMEDPLEPPSSTFLVLRLGCLLAQSCCLLGLPDLLFSADFIRLDGSTSWMFRFTGLLNHLDHFGSICNITSI